MMRWPIALALMVLLAPAPALAAPPALVAEAEPGAEQPGVDVATAARAQLSAGQFERAITLLTEGLEKTPGDPTLTGLMTEAKQKGADSYVATGKKLLGERRYREAGVAFSNALDLMPTHPIALKGKDAAEKWPTAEAYCNNAKDRLEKGELDEAIALYEKAYALTHDASIGKWLEQAKAARAKRR